MYERKNWFLKETRKGCHLRILLPLKACLYSSLTGDACYKVMLQSGNYDLVHELFEKMRRSGEVPEALTYKGSVLNLSYHLQQIFGS